MLCIFFLDQMVLSFLNCWAEGTLVELLWLAKVFGIKVIAAVAGGLPRGIEIETYTTQVDSTLKKCFCKLSNNYFKSNWGCSFIGIKLCARESAQSRPRGRRRIVKGPLPKAHRNAASWHLALLEGGGEQKMDSGHWYNVQIQQSIQLC